MSWKKIEIAFFDWKRQHTDEDFEKLITKVITKSQRRYEAKQNRNCRNGNHGFHLTSQITPGFIHTKCTNCGASWSSPDKPVTF